MSPVRSTGRVNHSGSGVTDTDSLMSLSLLGNRLRQASSSHSLKSMNILTAQWREGPGANHLAAFNKPFLDELSTELLHLKRNAIRKFYCTQWPTGPPPRVVLHQLRTTLQILKSYRRSKTSQSSSSGQIDNCQKG